MYRVAFKSVGLPLSGCLPVGCTFAHARLDSAAKLFLLILSQKKTAPAMGAVDKILGKHKITLLHNFLGTLADVASQSLPGTNLSKPNSQLVLSQV